MTLCNLMLSKRFDSVRASDKAWMIAAFESTVRVVALRPICNMVVTDRWLRVIWAERQAKG